jgi:hypothetical protein
MPRGIPGSGPNAGRGKGRKTKSHTLADIAARSGGGQQASNGQTATGSAAPAAAPAPAAASTGRGRGGKGRAKGAKTNARRGTGARGQRAGNGQQRADQAGASGKTGNGGSTGAAPQTDVNGVKIEVMAVPGRSGRPQQSEAFPFAALEIAEKTGDSIVGPSFLIPDSENPDNVLAAARKRHKGKTFTARKMEGGVRIWRLT